MTSFIRSPENIVGIQWALTGIMIAAWFVIAGQKIERKPARIFATISVVAGLFLIPACGGGGGGSGATASSSQVMVTGTPAGTYTVVVTATSGNRAQSLSLTLKVN